jgi:hypothetical protein
VRGVYAIGNTIYAATFGGGLSISTNGGGNWTTYKTTNGLGSDSLRGVYASGNNIYAATTAGVSISTNGGSSWTNYTNSNTSGGLGRGTVTGIYAIGSNIYASIDGGGLSVSRNNGSSWSNYTTTNGLGNNRVIGVYASDSKVYAATFGGGVSIARITSLTAKTPTSAGITSIPPRRSVMPKVKRGVPAGFSIPIQATSSPSSIEAIAFTGEERATSVAHIRPSSASQKYSKDEKFSAISASSASWLAATEMNCTRRARRTEAAPHAQS